MNQKYFLTQKEIKEIIKIYGGFRKYKYNYIPTMNYNNIYLCEKTNRNLFLCIRKMEYGVLITKCNETGLIIHRNVLSFEGLETIKDPMERE